VKKQFDFKMARDTSFIT